MDFFATGGFQQLYSELDDEGAGGPDAFCPLLGGLSDAAAGGCVPLDLGSLEDTVDCDYDYYGIITLDGNNNNTEKVDVPSFSHDFHDFVPDLSDWEQRLLDNFVEIPELVDFLPERTPLCTDNCADFLEESNSNLRLCAPGAGAQVAPPPVPSLPAPQGSNSNLQSPTALQSSAGERVGYLCTFGNCEKLYAKPAHLKAHLRRHMGEKPYACEWADCSWRFSRSDELARHRRSHSGVKPYKCEYCAKCFARSDHLTKHRKVHERRLLAATRAGRQLSEDVYAVRPGRKRKNQI
ncbi:hypothetical protein KR018_002205 [Drosophila ironensis]|nr:hypothetical protein KR018_002205 [Drosophila ironensis]